MMMSRLQNDIYCRHEQYRPHTKNDMSRTRNNVVKKLHRIDIFAKFVIVTH